MILYFINVTQENAKIQKPLVQSFTHIHSVATDNMKVDARITRLDLVCTAHDLPHPVGLAGTDVDIPTDGLLRTHDLFFRPVHQFQNLLCPLAQQHTILGQNDLPVSPDHQLLAQLLLQFFQLSGQGGLGQVQGLGRRRNILLSGYRQKVLQHSQFHSIHLRIP